MRKLFISALLFYSVTLFSQKTSDLRFDSNMVDAENSYVALPKKETEKSYVVGFVYFDETAGYTFDYTGNLTEENGILKYEERENAKVSSMKQRVGNLQFKTAKLSEDFLKAVQLNKEPEWLKYYKSSASEKEKTLNRASKMNGANSPDLALPKLLQLYNNNYRTEALYFELAFSYNAMGKFAEAEKICAEAINNKKADDLVRKEYVYALVHQEKIKEADGFLTENLSSFTTENNKIEAMINTVASSAHHNNLSVAEKWLKELRSQPNVNRYQKNIDQLESIIKEKKSIIQ